MNYGDIEDKYIKANVKGHYHFENAIEVKQVLGFNIKAIRGYKDLSEYNQQLAERLVCKFLNGFGLEAREEIKPTSIKREPGQFILKYKRDGNPTYSYLYDNGLVG